MKTVWFYSKRLHRARWWCIILWTVFFLDHSVIRTENRQIASQCEKSSDTNRALQLCNRHLSMLSVPSGQWSVVSGQWRITTMTVSQCHEMSVFLEGTQVVRSWLRCISPPVWEYHSVSDDVHRRILEHENVVRRMLHWVATFVVVHVSWRPVADDEWLYVVVDHVVVVVVCWSQTWSASYTTCLFPPHIHT